MSWRRRLILAAFAVVTFAAAAAFVGREELRRLHTVATLFDANRIVANFSAMDEAFHTVPLSRGPGRPLPEGPTLTLPDGAADWMADRAVTGLVVLSEGAVVHETYRLGSGRDDLRVSWSVAKSLLSLLTGVLVAEGAVALDDSVTAHAPRLAGSAYDGATLRDVLAMRSGVAFDENYAARDSDINKMGRVLAVGGALDAFTAGLSERRAAPGADWTYVSMDTHVAAMVLRGATGRTIPDLMRERLTGPMGLGPALYLADDKGTAFVLGGLLTSTRDYARIGQLVAEDGRAGGAQLVPAGWIDASTRRISETERFGYGLQWWLPTPAGPGEVFARGVYGQYLWIDRARGVVVAVNAADRRFAEPGRAAEDTRMLRAIATAAFTYR